jgi:hypothetical protein
MKKLVSGLVIGGILATCPLTYAETTSWIADMATFKVMVRGTEFISENPAVAVEGRTYLPLRAMGDVLGVSVEWNDELKQAEVDMAEKAPSTNSTIAPTKPTKTRWTATKATFKVMVRGKEFISENPPLVLDGRTYLPLRALGEVLGVSVEWNPELKQAEVDMKPAEVTPTPTPNKATTELSAGSLTAVIGSVEATKGKEIEVPINIEMKDFKGIMTTDFTISYDKDNLEFVEAVPGDIVKDPDTNFASNNLTAVGKIKFLYLTYSMNADESITTNGLFTKIKFKVKDTAKAGDYEIALFGTPTVGDEDLKLVKAEFKPGKITVK